MCVRVRSSPLIKATVFSFCSRCLCILGVRGHWNSLFPQPKHWGCVKPASITTGLHTVSTKKNIRAHSAHSPICNFPVRVGWHVFIAEDHFQTHRSWEPTLVSLALLTQTLTRIINSAALRKALQGRRKHCYSLLANSIDVKMGRYTPVLLLGVVCCVVQLEWAGMNQVFFRYLR